MRLFPVSATVVAVVAVAALVMVSVTLAACALAPAAGDPVGYDFGNVPVRAGEAKFRQAILVPEVAAPAWMDTPAIFYRLGYRDATRPEAYSGSRWVMPPATLLTNRLRQILAASTSGGVVVPADGVRTAYTLRLELEDFTQVFDSATTSRALLRVRASLLGNHALAAQRTFAVEVPAKTADAEGGVRALTAASEQVIGQVVEWTAGHVK